MIDSLGDRMKRYEAASRTVLTPRMPIIIRVDGKAFHTYTRPLKNSFNPDLREAMVRVSKYLCANIDGAKLAYTQSDEISVLVHPYMRFASSAWFSGEVQKIVSVSASIAAGVMTAGSSAIFGGITKIAQFDSRCFVLPEAEVCNYFVWRQQDCVRNSVQAHARSIFSHAQCNRKSQVVLKELCESVGRPWEDLDHWWQYGTVVERSGREWIDSGCDDYPVIFQEDRLHIERHLAKEEG